MQETKQDEGCGVKLITVQKTHLIMAMVFMVASPVVSGVASYHNARSQADSATMTRMLAEHSTDQEARFVQKVDFRPLETKINRIAEDVAEIKGFLRTRR